MNKRIVVLLGGISNEKEVSKVSGEAVYDALKEAGKLVEKYYLDDNIMEFVSFLEINKEEIVIFNALHGKYGEDGRVQGLLDLMRIPYSHSGVMVSAVAMNKILTKSIAKNIGLMVAKDQVIEVIDFKEGNLSISYPFVIKPIDEGSSVGIYLINNWSDFEEVRGKLLEFKELMIEEYIAGMECTVAVLGSEALGVTEIVPVNKFYDYDAKYVEGMSKHIIPARLDEDMLLKLKKDAQNIVGYLGIRGIGRVDFICNQNGCYLLEVNTQPGMTPTSLAPEQAIFNGISFAELCIKIVEGAKFDS